MKRTKPLKKLTVLAISGTLSVAGAMTSLAYTRLDTVEDLYWDEEHNKTLAVWDEIEDADQYEVYLYCEDRKVAEVKPKKAKYDFEKKMTKPGEYTFRVRALTKDRDYRDSYWSDYSDSIYISEDFAELIKNGGKIDTTNSGPGVSGTGTTTTPEKTTSVVYKAEWIQDAVGWWYRNADGTYPANNWWQDPANGKWYFFDPQGYMVTGWVDWNEHRYYCDPSGAMVTGTYTVDGITYQFDGSGAMMQ